MLSFIFHKVLLAFTWINKYVDKFNYIYSTILYVVVMLYILAVDASWINPIGISYEFQDQIKNETEKELIQTWCDTRCYFFHKPTKMFLIYNPKCSLHIATFLLIHLIFVGFIPFILRVYFCEDNKLNQIFQIRRHFDASRFITIIRKIITANSQAVCKNSFICYLVVIAIKFGITVSQLWWMHKTFYIPSFFGDLSESGDFPMVAYCNYFFHHPSSLPDHMNLIFPCILNDNILMARIYNSLWFWVLTLIILNFIKVFYWTIITTIFGQKCKQIFVQKQFEYVQKEITSNELDAFVKECITLDIYTTMFLISERHGDMISSNVIASMLEAFQRKKARKMK